MKNKVTKALIALVISSFLLIGISSSGLSHTTGGNFSIASIGDRKWERLGPAGFPARVKAVVFKKYVLDADHSVSWGQWTVSFDKESPTAYWLNCGGGNCDGGFTINKLVCTNSVSGRESCRFLFSFDRRRGSDCGLILGSQVEILGIRCPDEVQFEE